MREILFKARRKDNGEWVEGYYCRSFRWTGDENPVAAIQEADCYYFREVDSETICQYTGLTDKNGSKIWENDIVRRTDLHISTDPKEGIIWYDKDNTAFIIKWLNPVKYSATYVWKDRIEVIGNVFDNPDLLEG